MRFLSCILLVLSCTDGPVDGYQLAISRATANIKRNVRSLMMMSEPDESRKSDISDKMPSKVLETEITMSTSDARVVDPIVSKSKTLTDDNDASLFTFGPVIALAVVPIAAFLVWKNLQFDDETSAIGTSAVEIPQEEKVMTAKEEAAFQRARRAALIASTKADFEGRVELARENTAKENEAIAVVQKQRKAEEEKAILAEVALKEAELAKVAAIAKKEAEEKEVARLAAVAKKEAEEKEVARLAAVAKKEADEKVAARAQAEELAKAKWEAEIAASNVEEDLGSGSVAVSTPISVRQLLINKKKLSTEDEVSSAEVVSASLGGVEVSDDLPPRTARSFKRAEQAKDMDIFDTILQASMDTEMAGKAAKVG